MPGGGHRPLAGAGGLLRCRLPEWVALATPCLPAGLLDGPAGRAFERLPAAFPAAGSVGAFECRLEAGAAQVDFEICVTAAGGGRAALAAGLDAMADLIAGDPAWARTAAFARAWNEPGSALFDAVSAIWLEFDLAPEGLGPASPFIVVTLDPRLAFAEGPHGPRTRRAIAAALAVLSDGAGPSAAEAHLGRCLGALPPGGRPLHLALRPEAGTRLLRGIVALPWRETPGYLRALGWSGDTPQLADWLARTNPGRYLHSLNFDLLPELGPRIGVEYHFPTAPGSDPRWRTVLDALAERGALSPERRAQLHAWRTDESPPGLLAIERELLIKVVHQPGAPLAAKAYLPFSARLAAPIASLFAAAAAQADQRPGA